MAHKDLKALAELLTALARERDALIAERQSLQAEAIAQAQRKLRVLREYLDLARRRGDSRQ